VLINFLSVDILLNPNRIRNSNSRVFFLKIIFRAKSESLQISILNGISNLKIVYKIKNNSSVNILHSLKEVELFE
jgi:hypothetical protein